MLGVWHIVSCIQPVSRQGASLSSLPPPPLPFHCDPGSALVVAGRPQLSSPRNRCCTRSLVASQVL